MEFFKKRSNAVILAVVVAILFLFIGTTKSLNRLSNDIERTFTEGTEMDGFLQPSIQRQLDNRANAAIGLVTIGNHYPELKTETGELSVAVHALQDANTIEEKYLTNEQVEKAYIALSEKLNSHVNSEDSDALASYVSTLSGAQSVIAKGTYNSGVSEYYRIAKSFPAAVFGIFAHKPDYFGVEG